MRDFTRGKYKVSLVCREGTNDYYAGLSCFESDEYGLTAMGLKPGSIALDIGAHIGTATMLMACMGLNVYAFEVLKENYDALCQNVAANATPGKVTPAWRAVCGHNGLETVHLGSMADPMHRYMGNMYSNAPDTETVPAIDLNTIFAKNKIERCAIIKIDCEGAEWDIFAAASSDTLSRIDRIVGEYHTVTGVKGTRAALLDLLQGLFVDVSEGDDPGGLGHFDFVRGAA